MDGLTMQSKDNAPGMLLIQKYILFSSNHMTVCYCIHTVSLYNCTCLHTSVSSWRVTRCSCVDLWVLLSLCFPLSLSHSGHLGNKANFIRTLQSCIPQILSAWQPVNTQSEGEREEGGRPEEDRRKKRKAGGKQIYTLISSPYSRCLLQV